MVKLAIANASRRTNETTKSQTVRNTGNVLLYDFDSVTGTVSNGITLISNSNPYGVEFSSKTKLYVTENHFDSGGDNCGKCLNPIRFKEHKHSIIQDSNRDFTSLYIRLYIGH
jgi:hypothetical protein